MADITIKQGITSGFYWPLIDPATGAPPTDITKLTAKAQIRDKERPDGTLLYELAASVVEVGAAVHVVVSWTAADSLTWTWEEGFGDVLLYNDGEPVQIIWQGTALLDRVVTHA